MENNIEELYKAAKRLVEQLSYFEDEELDEDTERLKTELADAILQYEINKPIS